MPIIHNLVTATNGKPRYGDLTFCHICGSQEIIYDRADIDPKRHRHGLWKCTNCNACVAAHSDGKPLGYMAGSEIRGLRYAFHKALRRLEVQQYSYDDICSYLQCRLHIDAEHFHSAWLTRGELVMAITVMEERAKRPHKNRPYRVTVRRKIDSIAESSRNKTTRRRVGFSYDR